MSGLVGFFRAFLPSTSLNIHNSGATVNDDDNGSGSEKNAKTGEEVDGTRTADEEQGDYRLSLSSVTSAQQYCISSHAEADRGEANEEDANAVEEDDEDDDDEVIETQDDKKETQEENGDDTTEFDENEAASERCNDVDSKNRDVPCDSSIERRHHSSNKRDKEEFSSTHTGGSNDEKGEGHSDGEGECHSAQLPMTAHEWRLIRTEALQNFMTKRMVGGSDEDEDDEVWEGTDQSINEADDSDDESTCTSSTSSASSCSISDMENDEADRYQAETQDYGHPAGMRSKQTKRSEEVDDDEEDYEVPDNDNFIVPFLDTQDLTKPPEVGEGAETQQEQETEPVLETQDFGESPDVPDGTKTQQQHNEHEVELTPAPYLETKGIEVDKSTCRMLNDALDTPMKKRKRRGRKQSRKKYKITHIGDTSDSATTVHGLSLETKTLSLDLCELKMTWGLRNTRRMFWQDGHSTGTTVDGGKAGVVKQPQNITRKKRLLPLQPFKSWEDDGPLGTIYKEVLSVELIEVSTDSIDDGHDEEENGNDHITESMEERKAIVREAATAAFIHEDDEKYEWKKRRKRQRRRIRVFFYNKYATKVSEVLKKYREGRKFDGGTVLFSLRNIPAVCILPYNPCMADNYQCGASLVEHDDACGRLSNYCVCIGNKSQMRIESGDEESPIKRAYKPEKVRFDTEDMEIRIVKIPPDQTMAEKVKGGENGQQEREKNTDLCEIRINRNAVAIADRFLLAREEDSTLYRLYVKVLRRERERIRRRIEIERIQKHHLDRRQQDIEGSITGGNMTNQNPYQRQVVERPSRSVLQEARSTVELQANVCAPDGAEVRSRKEDDMTIGPKKMNGAGPHNIAFNDCRTSISKRQRLALHYLRLAELPSKMDSIRHEKEQVQSDFATYHKVDDTVNVFGAVTGFSSPCVTKRGDYMISVTLVDETLPLPSAQIDSSRPLKPGDRKNVTGENESNGSGRAAVARSDGGSIPCITLIIFVQDKKKLPRFRTAGDVLCAHRVGVQEWNKEIQLVGRRISSFTVIRPKSCGVELQRQNTVINSEDHWEVLPTAEKSFSFSHDDYTRSATLWRWAQWRISFHPTMNISQKFTISQMGRQHVNEVAQDPQQHKTVDGDMTAMIGAIIPVPDDQRNNVSPRGFLRVWDGTGPPLSDPLPIASILASESIRNGDPPSEALSSIAAILCDLREDRLAQEATETYTVQLAQAVKITPPKSLCGRVINVAIWEDAHWDFICSNKEAIGIGKFIRLRNVNDGRLSNGLRCLMVHAKSSLTPLPSKAYEVLSLLKEHNTRVDRRDPFNPQSGLLPIGACFKPRSISSRAAATSTASLSPTSCQNEFSRHIDDILPPINGCSWSGQRLSCLAECIGEPAPSTFLTRFSVDGTYPETHPSEGLRALCVPVDGSNSGANGTRENGKSKGKTSFQFAFHIHDHTAELDAIVSNDVAELILGVTADDVCANDNGGKNFQKGASANERGLCALRDIMKPTTVREGRIRSVLLDGAKYFVLESLLTVRHRENSVRRSGVLCENQNYALI